jgi:cellobiose phosphorylase
MFVAATQYLLGIRPELEGLKIEPRIPSSWKNYSVKRLFRGCLYDIKVKRTGTSRVFLNGKKVEGDIIRPVKGKCADIVVEI